MNMIRIQLDLPESRVKELDGLMREAHIRTRKDLFNSALTLLAWALNERNQGRIIASLDERSGGYKELVMPFFSFVSKGAEEKVTNNGNGDVEGADHVAARISEVARQSASDASEPGKGALGKAKGKTAGVNASAALVKGRR